MLRRHALPFAAFATLAAGCDTSTNTRFCSEDTPCMDPSRPFCDLNGDYGEARSCIPSPFDATPAQVTVSIELAGTGTGTVRTADEVISCDVGTCEFVVETGSELLLSANAGPGDSLVEWSGACEGFVECQLQVGADTEVRATFEPQGSVLWMTRPQRGPNLGGVTPFVRPAALAANSHDELVVVGSHVGTPNFGGGALISGDASQGSTEAFVAQFDKGGEHLWSHAYSGAGLSDDSMKSVVIGEDDSVRVGGTYEDSLSIGGTTFGERNIFLARFSRGGEIETAFAIPGGRSQSRPTLVDASGEFVAGTSPFLVEWYSEAGAHVRSATSEPQTSHPRFAAPDNSGGLLIAGAFGQATDFAPSAPEGLLTPLSPATYVVRYNADASFHSGHVVPTPLVQCLATQPGDDGHYVGGFVTERITLSGDAHTPAGTGDGFIARYAADNSLSWSTYMTSTTGAFATACTADARGNIIVGGAFQEDVRFAPGGAVHTATIGTFVAKYSGETGELLWSTIGEGEAGVAALTSDSVGRIAAAITMTGGDLTIGGETIPGEEGDNLLLLQLAP